MTGRAELCYLPAEAISPYRAAAAYERLRPWLDAPSRRPSL